MSLFVLPGNGLIRHLLMLVVLAAAVGAQAEDLLLELRGNPAPGALLIGRTVPGAKVMLEDRLVEVSSEGWFALGFGRDAEGARTLRLEYDQKNDTRELVLAARDWNIQRIEGVPQETVTPPEELLARIREEAGRVWTARQHLSKRQDFLEPFAWPASGPITGVYGSQRFYNGEPKNPHYGIDIAAPEGAPVHAPVGGIVRLADPDLFYSGGTLIIDHGYGVSSTFLHLHRILVKEGEEVAQGEVVAEVGSTGRSTGPHLDWRINWFGERLDPQWFMGAMDATRVDASLNVAEKDTR